MNKVSEMQNTSKCINIHKIGIGIGIGKNCGASWGWEVFTSFHKTLQETALVLGWVLGTQSCLKPGLSSRNTHRMVSTELGIG